MLVEKRTERHKKKDHKSKRGDISAQLSETNIQS